MKKKNIDAQARKAQQRLIKVLVFAVALTLMMIAFLSWHITKVPDLLELVKQKKLPNIEWILRYSTVLLPSIVLSAFLTLFYCGKDYTPIETQKDKAAIVGAVTALVYLVVLPAVAAMSPDWRAIHSPQIEMVATPLSKSVIWFAVQIIPLLIIFSYHLTRARAEEKELEKNEDE